MRQFNAAESIENNTEEISVSDAKFRRLEKIVDALKRMKLKVIENSIDKDSLEEPDADIALTIDGCVHASNNNGKVHIFFAHELSDPENSQRQRIMRQLKDEELI